LTNVRWPKENAASKVGVFDGVHVAHFNVANANQNQILYNFVAKRSSTNYQDLGFCQGRLIPPGD
jgi:FAD synthase